GASGRRLSAIAGDDRVAGAIQRGRIHAIRKFEEDLYVPHGERKASEVSVQLQRCDRRETARRQHRAEGRRHDCGAVRGMMRMLRSALWASLCVVVLAAPATRAQQQTPDQSSGPIPAYHSPLATAADNGETTNTQELAPDTNSLS